MKLVELNDLQEVVGRVTGKLLFDNGQIYGTLDQGNYFRKLKRETRLRRIRKAAWSLKIILLESQEEAVLDCVMCVGTPWFADVWIKLGT